MKYSSQAGILQVVGCVSSLTAQSHFISERLLFQATMQPILPAGTTLLHHSTNLAHITAHNGLSILDLVTIVSKTSDSLCL
jgi:hypothetical protein